MPKFVCSTLTFHADFLKNYPVLLEFHRNRLKQTRKEIFVVSCEKFQISGTNWLLNKIATATANTGKMRMEADKPRCILAGRWNTKIEETSRRVRATDTAKFLLRNRRRRRKRRGEIFGAVERDRTSRKAATGLLCWSAKGRKKEAEKKRGEETEDWTGFSDLCPGHARFSFLA